MQQTHNTDGPGLPDYPHDLAIADVNVYMHGSGMLSTHDYSCPVCREKHAVLNMSNGVMGPCWDCRKEGYAMIKAERSWWKDFLFSMLTGNDRR